VSVWLTIPSARPPEEAAPILKLWRERGYKIALWRDNIADFPFGAADFIRSDPDGYPGYAVAVNTLISDLIRTEHAQAEWFIAAGDDTEPDPYRTAEEICDGCKAYFNGYHLLEASDYDNPLTTFGVMQPTGDRWHEGVGGFGNAPIDRVAGSAWYGREYCRRMYGGQGPLFPGYRHMFVDEEAQEVAIKMGVFWQRRDLVQKHRHWGRGATDKTIVTHPRIPPHLEQWNTPEHWRQAKLLFESRKAAAFPGHEPIP